MLQRLSFATMGCPAALPSGVDASLLPSLRAELDRLDRRYSHFQEDSLLGELALLAGSGRWVATTREDEALFDLGDALHRASDGAFDPTVGPLLRLWDFRAARVPSVDSLAAARARVGWAYFERESGRARLTRAGMGLDFGGQVKEYAADRLVVLARSFGLPHGLIDLGGDLAVIGPQPNGEPWRVGIRQPGRAESAIARVLLHAGGLASSGTDARCFEYAGRRYSHLIDARSGEPIAAGFDAVSVCARPA